MIGYQFSWNKEKTPMDCLTDPETGLRPDQKTPPAGLIGSWLTTGIEHTTLPPLKIWNEGVWMTEFVQEHPDIQVNTRGDERFNTWVTSGEGTPGNYAWRSFVLPDDEARDLNPKHPKMWPKVKTSWGGKESTTTIPCITRFRCQGCGHWFQNIDMKEHVELACPGQQPSRTTEWVIPCDSKCCESLDKMAECKPGFPVPKPAVPVGVEVVAGGGSETAS